MCIQPWKFFTNMKLVSKLPYHSPHKFRHGHIQYGLARSVSIADYKAVSLNVLHANMEITDQFYSNINDGEVQNRIALLSKAKEIADNDVERTIKEFRTWKNKQNK
jgi:hypothetical protein